MTPQPAPTAPTFSVGPTQPGVGSPFTVAASLTIDPAALGREISTWSTPDLARFLMGLSQGVHDQDYGHAAIADAARYAEKLTATSREEGMLGSFAYTLTNNVSGIKS